MRVGEGEGCDGDWMGAKKIVIREASGKTMRDFEESLVGTGFLDLEFFCHSKNNGSHPRKSLANSNECRPQARCRWCAGGMDGCSERERIVSTSKDLDSFACSEPNTTLLCLSAA